MGAFGGQVALGVLCFIGMEAFAWVVHRYVMHGLLWRWHRSHHEPREGLFEKNDLFAVVFAAPAVLCFLLARGSGWWLAPAIGITAYGAVYALFHDGIVHRRFPLLASWRRGALMRRLVQAHRLHHAVHTREGGVSFGFLWAPPARALKARLSAKGAFTAAGEGG